MCVHVCFCFKQKTAYEMRISDWSSDVCSSDLVHQNIPEGLGLEADLRRPLRVAPMLIAGELERAGRGPEGLGVEPAFLDRVADSTGGAQPVGEPERALPKSSIGLDRQGRGLT